MTYARRTEIAQLLLDRLVDAREKRVDPRIVALRKRQLYAWCYSAQLRTLYEMAKMERDRGVRL